MAIKDTPTEDPGTNFTHGRDFLVPMNLQGRINHTRTVYKQKRTGKRGTYQTF